MKQKKTDSFPVASERNLVWFSRAMVCLCGAILIARLISAYFPRERLWGINHLAHFSSEFAIGITFLGLLFFIPVMNRRIQSIIEKTLTFFYKFTINKHKYLWFVILSLGSLALFVVFRNRTYFLGDGPWLLSLVTDEGLHIGWAEPLEYLLHIFVYRSMGQFLVITGFDAYAVVSYMAGVLFVFFTFLLADTLGANKTSKVLIFSIIATMGGVELFFGYPEHYAFSYVCMLVYVILGIRYLYGKTNILIPSVIFVLAVLFHLSSFYLLPSLVFLHLSGSSHSKVRSHKPRLRKHGVVVAVLLLSAGACWYIVKSIKSAVFLRSAWGIFVPLSQAKPDAPGYTLFSLHHLLDVFNQQLLLSPIGAVLLLTVMIFVGKKRILEDKVAGFLGIISIFQLIYSFLLDPFLGAARDWDLFSATALGYTVLAIYLFLGLVKDAQRVRYIGSVLVVTSLLSTTPWVVLNADTDKSIRRARTLTDLDPKRSIGVRRALWAYFEDRGMTEESLKEQIRMMEGIPELVLYNLGIGYLNMGEVDSAIVAFERAIEIDKSFAEAHYGLGRCYTAIGRPERAILEYQRALALGPKKNFAADCYVRLGDIYTQKRQFDRATEMYRAATKGIIKDKKKLYQNLGHCYLVKGEVDEAISMYRKALKLNPKFVEPHLYLGHAYLKKGMKDKAIEEYRIYLKYATDNKETERVKTLMSTLNKE
jgi:tetratricopeptide (TPR) repeat protein